MDERVDEGSVREFLKSNNCKLGGVLYTTEDMEFSTEINIDHTETDPYLAFNSYLDESSKVEDLKYFEDMKHYSEECIKEARGEI